MSEPTVMEQIRLSVPVEVVWPLISDPANYPRWSPEASATVRRSGTGPWRVGDRFVGTNRLWVPWFTVCTVTERTEMQRFAFDVDLGPLRIANWAYEVEPDGHGTLVREIWTDRRTGVFGAPVKLAGPVVGRGRDAAAHNRVTMQATLAALRDAVEAVGS